MTVFRRFWALLAGAGLLVVLGSAGQPTITITVPAGADTQAFLDAAPEGSVVRLASGVHRGPLVVDKAMSLVGDTGARIEAPVDSDAAVHVTARDVLISNLHVIGGWTGIDLDDAAGSIVRDVVVTGADLQGIRVYKAAALVDSVSVSGLLDAHAQGIEVLSAPDVVVRNSQVTGGKIGIVAHLSDSLFEDNRVSGTSLVGLMIREMGRGTARGNHVTNAAGAGLYCGDMALCAFEDNRVERVSAAGNARSNNGWGLVVNYRGTASTKGDVLAGAAGSAVALVGSRLVEESPLTLGQGAGALVPASAAVGAALVLLGLAYLVGRAFPKPSFGSSVGRSPLVPGLAVVVVAALVVQSFHLFEHFLQVYRVHFDGVPSRGGLAGPRVEAEWVHFIYNTAIMVLIAGLVAARAAGWLHSVKSITSDRLLIAVGLIQGYHVVEHMAKLTQHLATGHKVNPGIFGRYFDLVWMHFSINLAVYIGFLAAVAIYAYAHIRTRRTSTAHEPAAAGST